MNQEQEDKLLLQLIIQGLEKLDKSVSDIDEKVNGIHITMARNTESLQEHIRRTELLEEQLFPIKATHDGLTFTGVLIAKIAGALVIIATLLAAAWEALKLILRVP